MPLNPLEKQEVQFCIPYEVRDEQLKLNLKRIKKRVEPATSTTEEPVAVVCYGPSLKDTWEEIKNFKTIITCSGAHKFLLERGIIPTYHIDVDPREHKPLLLGEPHKDVKYLLASVIHPSYLDKLEGFDVYLWHVFETELDTMRLVPRGEWSMTGGSSVGLRTMVMARFLGFTNIHMFGMDGSYDDNGSHADFHPNSMFKIKKECEYNGKKYWTTIGVMECARQTFHELDLLPDVNIKFYGEGLVQEMAKDYVRPEKKPSFIGFLKPKIISDEYLEELRDLFRRYPDYGIGGAKHKDMVLKLKSASKSESILDYGCGRGYLGKSLDFPIWEYDPAVPGKDEAPRPADLVICTDVLEHIEEDKIHLVLNDIQQVTKKMTYLVISLREAKKKLKDGRNAHLLVRDVNFWNKQIGPFFLINDAWEVKPYAEYHMVLVPKYELNTTILQ